MTKQCAPSATNATNSLKDIGYKQMYVDIVKKKYNLSETRNSDWNSFKKIKEYQQMRLSWKTRKQKKNKQWTTDHIFELMKKETTNNAKK